MIATTTKTLRQISFKQDHADGVLTCIQKGRTACHSAFCESSP
jgi:hypothetical protein